MIKMIAVDLDGTLLDEAGGLSVRTIQAVGQARSEGIKVVLTSGRPLSGMQSIIKTLTLDQEDEYVISYGGALVQQMPSAQVIASKTLKGSDLRYCYQLALAADCGCQAFISEGVVTPRFSAYIYAENSYVGMTAQLSDFEKIEDETEVIKFMFIDAPHTLDALSRSLPEVFYKQYTVIRSTPVILEVLNPLAGKWQGIRALSHHLGIHQQEIMTLGDEANDIEMLQQAGLGIAMGNASRVVQMAADQVTLNNGQDGVAVAIEKLLSEGK